MKDLLKKMQQLQASTSPSASVSEVLKGIQNRFNYLLLSKYGTNLAQNVFEILWHFLMDAASNPDSTIRIEAHKTSSIFLVRMSPFFPHLVQNLFINPNYLPQDNNPFAYLFVAQTFAWMTHDIDPVYIKQFLSESDAQKYFACQDSKVAFYIPKCILQLKNVHFDWYKILLDLLLPLINVSSSDTYLQQSITAVIQQCPALTEYLMREINKGTSQSIQGALPLISYLISHQAGNLTKPDLFLAAVEAVKVLDTAANATLTEAAFTVLSYPSSSFEIKLNLKLGSVDTFYLIVWKSSQDTEKHIVTFSLSRFQNSSKYKLPLPYDVFPINKLDNPNDNLSFHPESDLDLKAQFSALANIVIKALDYDNTIQRIFLKFKDALLTEYSTNTLSILSAFTQCASRLLEFQKFKQNRSDMIYLLRTLFFMEPHDQIHQITIYKLMRAVTIKKMRHLFDEHTFSIIQKQLIVATLECDSKYFSDIVSTLIAFARVSGHEIIIEMIFDQIDVFDTSKFEQSLTAASLVGEDAEVLDILYLLSSIYTIIESVSFNELSLPFITAAFRYLSLFNLGDLPLADMNDIPSIMSQLIIESINFLLGTSFKTKPTRFDTALCQAQIAQMFRTRDIEILGNNPVGTRIEIHPQLYYSLRLFANMPLDVAIAALFPAISDSVVQLFPIMSSEVLMRYFHFLVKSDRIQVFRALAPHLKKYPNIDVAAKWLKMASDPNNEALMAQAGSFKTGLLSSIPLIPSLDTTGKFVQHRSILFYTKCALGIPDQKNKLIEAMGTLSEEQQTNYLILLRKQDEQVVNELTTKPPDLPVDFTEGVLESMKQMVEMTKLIYSEIKNRVEKKAKIQQSEIMRQNLRTNMFKSIDDSYEALFDPYFYIAQLKFKTIPIEPKKLQLLMTYFCNLGIKSGIKECIKCSFPEKGMGKRNESSLDLTEFAYPVEFLPDIFSLLLKKQYDKLNPGFIDKYSPQPPEKNDTKIRTFNKYLSPYALLNRLVYHPDIAFNTLKNVHKPEKAIIEYIHIISLANSVKFNTLENKAGNVISQLEDVIKYHFDEGDSDIAQLFFPYASLLFAVELNNIKAFSMGNVNSNVQANIKAIAQNISMQKIAFPIEYFMAIFQSIEKLELIDKVNLDSLVSTLKDDRSQFLLNAVKKPDSSSLEPIIKSKLQSKDIMQIIDALYIMDRGFISLSKSKGNTSDSFLVKLLPVVISFISEYQSIPLIHKQVSLITQKAFQMKEAKFASGFLNNFYSEQPLPYFELYLDSLPLLFSLPEHSITEMPIYEYPTPEFLDLLFRSAELSYASKTAINDRFSVVADFTGKMCSILSQQPLSYYSSKICQLVIRIAYKYAQTSKNIDSNLPDYVSIIFVQLQKFNIKFLPYYAAIREFIDQNNFRMLDDESKAAIKDQFAAAMTHNSGIKPDQRDLILDYFEVYNEKITAYIARLPRQDRLFELRSKIRRPMP